MLPPLSALKLERDDILNELHEFFLLTDPNSNQQPRVALVGSEGIDKQSIASTFVHKMTETFEDTSLFWIDAMSENDIEESLKTMESTLAPLPVWPTRTVQADAFSRLLRHLNWTFHGPWLMVLNGLNCGTAAYLTFQNLIPQGLKGGLLITTSKPNCLRLLDNVKIIQVPFSRG